ncbi:hypothetical protein ACA910_005785 [Epithemia clementina (nom. ined.)]
MVVSCYVPDNARLLPATLHGYRDDSMGPGVASSPTSCTSLCTDSFDTTVSVQSSSFASTVPMASSNIVANPGNRLVIYSYRRDMEEGKPYHKFAFKAGDKIERRYVHGKEFGFGTNLGNVTYNDVMQDVVNAYGSDPKLEWKVVCPLCKKTPCLGIDYDCLIPGIVASKPIEIKTQFDLYWYLRRQAGKKYHGLLYDPPLIPGCIDFFIEHYCANLSNVSGF